mgnify:FL=1|jgi:hypothetical protein
MTEFDDEIERWRLHGPDIVPQYCPVDPQDIEDLRKIALVPQGLSDFWLARGSGQFNTDSKGRSVSVWLTNVLLDPSEITDLILNTAGVVEHLLPHGLPFFNMFDLEFMVVSTDGKVAEVNPDDTVTVMAGSICEFIERLVEWPIFHEPLR